MFFYTIIADEGLGLVANATVLRRKADVKYLNSNFPTKVTLMTFFHRYPSFGG